MLTRCKNVIFSLCIKQVCPTQTLIMRLWDMHLCVNRKTYSSWSSVGQRLVGISFIRKGADLPVTDLPPLTWSWLQEAVCLRHGNELSLKTLTSGPSCVWRWTKGFQLQRILLLDPAGAPLRPQTAIPGSALAVKHARSHYSVKLKSYKTHCESAVESTLVYTRCLR